MDDAALARNLTRRGLLAGAGTLTALAATSPPSAATHRAEAAAANADLGRLDHLIFVMLENRSYDHYFGAYPRGRGFSDHARGQLGAFSQADPTNLTAAPLGRRLPFHVSLAHGAGGCLSDLATDWDCSHLAWNSGAMDGFVSAHSLPQFDGPTLGAQTMGYYTRSDLPFHYALADRFTLCDHYFSSVLGSTHANRAMAMSGSVDPDGVAGGPLITNATSPDQLLSMTWTTAPEVLSGAGVDWRVYSPRARRFDPSQPTLDFGDNVLALFRAYATPGSDLAQRAFSSTYPDDFFTDLRAGRLPQVSWILAPPGYDEHPPAPSVLGAAFLSKLLGALTSRPALWSRTAIFLTWDEAGGFFDHVAPPTAPPGTAQEWLASAPPGTSGAVAGPIGLGFRVPMLILSPLSRGGRLLTGTFDHTSMLRLLERRFLVRFPGISPWRRATVGDLSSAFRAAKPDLSALKLPSSAGAIATARHEGCTGPQTAGAAVPAAPYPPPARQSMPSQTA